MCLAVKGYLVLDADLENLQAILLESYFQILSTLTLSACSTAKKSTGVGSGDVYTGSQTVEYLASGVKDRVFFATNSSSLTTASSI